MGLDAAYRDLGFRYVYAGYIGGDPQTCQDVHDLAEASGYLGRMTVLEDSGFVTYRTLMNDRDGTPQFLFLDRQMRIRAHLQDWYPASYPAAIQSLIETLLAE